MDVLLAGVERVELCATRQRKAISSSNVSSVPGQILQLGSLMR